MVRNRRGRGASLTVGHRRGEREREKETHRTHRTQTHVAAGLLPLEDARHHLSASGLSVVLCRLAV